MFKESASTPSGNFREKRKKGKKKKEKRKRKKEKGKKKKENRKRKRKRSVLAAANIQKAHLDFGLELSSGLVRSMESLRLGEKETALLP